jgi:hypothetical protein
VNCGVEVREHGTALLAARVKDGLKVGGECVAVIALAANWRMAWVATVTIHDKRGDALHTIRYGAMPEDTVESLLHGAAGDVNELLRKRPRLKVALLSDGAHELVDHLAVQVAKRVDREVVQILEFWHLIEKLGATVSLLDGDPARRLARWKLNLLNVEHYVGQIVRELRMRGCEPFAFQI